LVKLDSTNDHVVAFQNTNKDQCVYYMWQQDLLPSGKSNTRYLLWWSSYGKRPTEEI